MKTLLQLRLSPSPPDAGAHPVLEPGDDPAALAAQYGEHFAALPLIAVRFPSFTDGRGYSIARLLRERLGFRGELRAVGDIARDQLHYLARCGFDSFELREGEDVATAKAALAAFSDAYQAAVDQPVPLFRRRVAREKGSDPFFR